MNKVLIGAMIVGVTFGLGVTAMSKSSGTGVIDWHKGGKSTKINYSKHMAKGVKCNDCHRRHKNGKRYMKKCGTCHGSQANALKVGHKMCKDCHKRKGGPTTCKGCH
jgi:hypothetical protein